MSGQRRHWHQPGPAVAVPQVWVAISINATTLQTSANFNIQSTATTSITGVIRQLASQTADLLQFQSSTGAATSGVNSAGNYYFAQTAAFTDVRSLPPQRPTALLPSRMPAARPLPPVTLTNITATGTLPVAPGTARRWARRMAAPV